MLYLKLTVQYVSIFAIAALAAYAFGFHMLFAHAAIEAFYWGGYFLAWLLAGTLVVKGISSMRPITL